MSRTLFLASAACSAWLAATTAGCARSDGFDERDGALATDASVPDGIIGDGSNPLADGSVVRDGGAGGQEDAATSADAGIQCAQDEYLPVLPQLTGNARDPYVVVLPDGYGWVKGGGSDWHIVQTDEEMQYYRSPVVLQGLPHEVSGGVVPQTTQEGATLQGAYWEALDQIAVFLGSPAGGGGSYLALFNRDGVMTSPAYEVGPADSLLVYAGSLGERFFCLYCSATSPKACTVTTLDAVGSSGPLTLPAPIAPIGAVLRPEGLVVFENAAEVAMGLSSRVVHADGTISATRSLLSEDWRVTGVAALPGLVGDSVDAIVAGKDPLDSSGKNKRYLLSMRSDGSLVGPLTEVFAADAIIATRFAIEGTVGYGLLVAADFSPNYERRIVFRRLTAERSLRQETILQKSSGEVGAYFLIWRKDHYVASWGDSTGELACR